VNDLGLEARHSAFWDTKGVRVITLMSILAMGGSLSTYADWLGSGNHHGLSEYLGVIGAIVVAWIVGLVILKHRFDRSPHTP
jgi:hypothetical protein